MCSGRRGVAVNIEIHLVVVDVEWWMWSCCKYSGTFSSGGCIVIDVELL